MKKYNQLKNYYKKSVINILISKVIYEKLEIIPKKIKLNCKVIRKEILATHYLYLFIFFGQKPYLWKEVKALTQHNSRIMIKKMNALSVQFTKTNKSFFYLSKLLFELINFQFSSPKNIIEPIYVFDKIIINLEQALLGKKTEKLKSKYNYFNDFGIKVEIVFNTTSIYEKLFILKHIGFIDVENKILDLNYIENDN